jgi:hypothetical protein
VQRAECRMQSEELTGRATVSTPNSAFCTLPSALSF